MENTKLKKIIASLLGEEVTHFELKGRGMCNNAYYLETAQGNAYLVKEERPDKETGEQNNLVVEGRIIQKLHTLDANLPVPRVAFVSETPPLYGYTYLNGAMMINLWPSLSEQQRLALFESMGYFHAMLGRYIDEGAARAIGLVIDFNNITPESYNSFLNDSELPDDWKDAAQEAHRIFNGTHDKAVFQCIHNDAHDKNILLDSNGKLLSFVDFGDTEFADVHKDFCYYVRDYPDYCKCAIDSYTAHSGNELSFQRIVSCALLRDLGKIAWGFHNPENEQKQLQKHPGIPVGQRVENYKRLLV